jgi:hypothetical protein
VVDIDAADKLVEKLDKWKAAGEVDTYIVVSEVDSFVEQEVDIGVEIAETEVGRMVVLEVDSFVEQEVDIAEVAKARELLTEDCKVEVDKLVEEVVEIVVNGIDYRAAEVVEVVGVAEVDKVAVIVEEVVELVDTGVEEGGIDIQVDKLIVVAEAVEVDRIVKWGEKLGEGHIVAVVDGGVEGEEADIFVTEVDIVGEGIDNGVENIVPVAVIADIVVIAAVVVGMTEVDKIVVVVSAFEGES